MISNSNICKKSKLRMNGIVRAILLPSIVSFAFLNQSLATELDPSKKLDKKAKYRLYPGGKDEEDLKVQAQLPGPGKRMNIETKATQESD